MTNIEELNLAQVVNEPLPGMLGELKVYYKAIAPYPNDTVALVGAIAFMAGICGRAYNGNNTGVNQYLLMLAPTGIGKDAIASGSSSLTIELLPTCPCINDFTGPGEISSGPALIKAFAVSKTGCFRSNVGELGKQLEQMSGPKAAAHLKTLNRTLLQMYTKSGHREVFDAMAYADTKNNVAPLQSPSLTLVGESVPETFYNALDEGMIADGLLPRFLVFETNSPKPYKNKGHATYRPDAAFISRLNDVAAHCLGVMRRSEVHHVSFTPEAEAKLDEFDRWTVDYVNENKGEVKRQLRSRDSLKAGRLAALIAIGENYLNPVITLDHVMWATRLVVALTDNLIAKFDNGETGTVDGNQLKQLEAVQLVIADYLAEPELMQKYGPKGRYDIWQEHIITHSHMVRRLYPRPLFSKDRMGAEYALNRAVKSLLSDDVIREMPQSQMSAKFGTKPKAYVVANPEGIVEAIKKGGKV